MKTIIYENKYGFIELELVGDQMNVSQVDSSRLDDSLFFDINKAEQVALITGNNKIQLSFKYPGFKKAYICYHHNYDTVSIAKIKNIVFNNAINARQEIEDIAKTKSLTHYN